MIYKIDLIIYKECKKFTEYYSKITGRDNFHLAKLTLYVSLLVILFSQYLDLFSDSRSITWSVIISVAWTFDTWLSHKSFTKLEEKIENSLESGTIDYSALLIIDHLVQSRTILFVISAFFTPLALIALFVSFDVGTLSSAILFIGIILRALSYYFATCFHPGGKSAWQRLKEKLKEKLEELTPSLTPAPVGATS